MLVILSGNFFTLSKLLQLTGERVEREREREREREKAPCLSVKNI
jgi:hypothetical protein